MHPLKAPVTAAALLSTTISGADVAVDLETRSNLEARTYRYAYDNNVEKCKADLRWHKPYAFCKSFVPATTVRKTVYKKKGTKTVEKTKFAPCTTPGYHVPPYYGKREASAESEARPDAETHYYTSRHKKCYRKGISHRFGKYPCEVITKACRAYVKPNTKTVSQAGNVVGVAGSQADKFILSR
jgi:hypothetical protein